MRPLPKDKIVGRDDWKCFEREVVEVRVCARRRESQEGGERMDLAVVG
jgi:hypothetical protein